MGSRLFYTLLAGALLAGALPAGCATGVGDGTETDPITEQPAAGGGGADPTTTTGAGGMGGTSNMGGDEGGNMGPVCDPPLHKCGGICVDNTPGTGCYQSTDCTPCPTPNNGSATCTVNGQCDVSCNNPYQKLGLDCVCPNQCCTDADCGGGATCNNGTCESPPTCDQALCIAVCGLQGQIGICNGPNCICI